MFRKTCGWITILIGTSMLSGCAGTDSELLDGLNANEQTPLCISPQSIGVDFFQANDGKRYFSKAGDVSFTPAQSNIDALPALKKKGYAKEEATSLPSGFARYIDAFEATDKIDPYIGQFENLCIGKMKATKIIEYTEPATGGPQIIEARFNYKIDFNKFVDDLGIEDELIDGPIARNWPGEGFATYVKTNKGWRMEMARWASL